MSKLANEIFDLNIVFDFLLYFDLSVLFADPE